MEKLIKHPSNVQSNMANRAETDDTKNTINSVGISLSIIETLSTMNGATLSEVAEEENLPSSTAYSHLRTLAEHGYVVKDRREYSLSFRFLEYGGKLRQNLEFYQSTKSYVDQLAIETGEIAGIGIEQNGSRVLLYKNEGENAVADNRPVGEHTDLHWTALGKCLLAYQPEERIHEIIEGAELLDATTATITDEASLLGELQQIREQGYAIDNGERIPTVRGVAVPIAQETGNVVGALGLAGPRNRFDNAFVARALDMLEDRRTLVELELEYY